MATSNPLTKVARQHETTWTQLHKRISDVPFRFEDVFPQEIATFLRNKAVSLNSSISYFTPAILTTTAFLSAKNGCTVVVIDWHSGVISTRRPRGAPKTRAKSTRRAKNTRQIHAVSTRRAKNTRHFPRIVHAARQQHAPFPRGVHAARHTHVPYVEM